MPRSTSGGARPGGLTPSLATGMRIVLWTFAVVTLLLGAWVLLGWTVPGWSPVVVSGDSMHSTLDAGDVVLVAADDQAVGRPDAGDSVQDDAALGSGRLVIPMVGLPIVWAQGGNWILLGAWALLTAAGAIVVAQAVARALRRRRAVDVLAAVSVARVGIQRVRLLTAVLILGHVMIGGDGGIDPSDRGTQISLLAVVVLLVTNALSALQARRGNFGERSVALVELVIDTSLVLVLTTSTDTGLTWVLLALPIIEAAVRFRLAGALVHWMVLTGITISIEVWKSADQSASDTVRNLESRLDQLGVLFLFVIPAAYLAEQLISEVGTWQRATGRARTRSELLARVAEVGREVTRLEGSHVETILDGVRSVGFARVDMVTDHSDHQWHVVAGDSLPEPGGAASGTRRVDLGRRASITTADDPDASEAAAIVEAGFDAVITHLVSDLGGHRIVLRAATLPDDPITTERIEAFRLVAGQATVALQNDRLMAEVTSMHDELEHRASHDGLTGLPNRTMMLRRLREAQHAGRIPTILFLDLDGFKPVNDRLGHDVGDTLLQRVSDRLVETLPESALVARLGGDEFTILLTDHDDDASEALAQRVVDAITAPFRLGDQVVSISTSVGIAQGRPDLDDAEVIRRADVSMYQAKQAEDRSVEVYRAEFDDAAERRAQLTVDIGQAIEQRSLHLAYQPVVDVRRGNRIIGAEALVRWEHPVFGRIPPGETIDLAHTSNRSDELNAYIVETAIQWIARVHQITGGTDLFVAVNASSDELNSTSLADGLVDAARRAGVAPSSIAVEISERIVTPVSETAQRNMEELQATGVQLLLDDFGEETSSLTYLQELPIDGVKLDRRLVVNALRSRTDRLVLDSIIELSHRIGHRVIAEGVESEAHLAAILDAGCGLVQGYHFHEPMSGDDLTLLLLQRRGDDDSEVPGDVGRAVEFESWTQPLVEPTAAPVDVPVSASQVPVLPASEEMRR